MIQTAAHHAAAALTTATPVFGYVLVPLPDYILVPLTGAIVVLAGVLIAALFAARVKRSATLQSREVLAGSAFLAEQLELLQTALAAADARVAALAARLDEHSRTTQIGSSTSYNVAMARSGASRQELMTACGVTQQEADLVLRLHSADPAARSAA
jgi:Protein of unknown function (DUF2802)